MLILEGQVKNTRSLITMRRVTLLCEIFSGIFLYNYFNESSLYSRSNIERNTIYGYTSS